MAITKNLSITQTVDGGNTSQKRIVLKTKDTYVLDDIHVDVTATATEGTFANTLPSGVDPSSYESNTSQETVIPAGGNLYLSGGWYPKQKISLAHLIPEIAENDAGVSEILTGYSAFTDDGRQITGTMPRITPEFDGGVVSTTATLNYIAPSGKIVAEGTLIPGTSQGQLGDNYGVTTTQPTTGNDGEHFLTIGTDLNVTKIGSVYATSTANRTAVSYNGNAVGYLDKTDDTVALDAPSQDVTDTSNTQQINLSSVVSDDFGTLYIPIVKKIETEGGGVEKTEQTSNVTCTVSDVSLTSSGKFTEVNSGGTGANYGVHKVTSGLNTTPDGTDGVNYLKIQTIGSGGTATVSGSVTVNYNRSAVLSKSEYKGLVSLNDNEILNAATSGSLTANVSGTAEADITGGDSYYYIDIVEPKGSAPTITPTSVSDTLAFNNNVKPSVHTNIDGTITEGDEYGVTPEKPSGEDGSNYLTISQNSTPTTGTLSGSATITYTRSAVKSEKVYKGAVSMTTDTVLVSEAQNQTITRTLSSKSITPTATHGNKLYIPITEPTLDGGGLNDAQITITPSGSVTPSIGLFYKNGNSQGTEQVDSDFGVQTDVPTTGEWVVLDPNASPNNVVINASLDVTRSEVTVSGSAGLWNGTGDSIVESNKTYRGREDFDITINNGITKYIPIVKGSCTASYLVTENPKVTTETTASTSTSESVPAGVVTSTTAPSDYTSYNSGYIVISPSISLNTSGTVDAKANGSIGTGITKAGAFTENVATATVTTEVSNTGAKTYIKIYDGDYAVEDL